MKPRRSTIGGAFALARSSVRFPPARSLAIALLATTVPIVAAAYVARPTSPAITAQDGVTASLTAAAALSVLNGPPAATIRDPGPVLEALAVSPVVRAMRAEQIALASRKRSPETLALPPGLEDMHPSVAAKTAQALHVLALPAPTTAPSPRPASTWWRRAGRLLKPARRTTPTPFVATAIQDASSLTGVSADYLQRAARRESAFNPFARATTSSATGLFQFVEATWLGLMRKHGARYGYAREASAIQLTAGGRPVVSDPMMRAHILALRMDPQLASLLAGHLTRDNAEAWQRATGRPASAGDLYVAHVLGSDGAISLMRAAVITPERPARDVLPGAAAANKKLFYRGSVALSARTTYLLLRLKGEIA